MIIYLIPSYVVRWVGHNQGHLSTQILSYPKLVLVCQTPELHVVNRTQGGHRFEKLAHCGSSLFAQDRRCRMLTVMHDIFLCHLLRACIGSFSTKNFAVHFPSAMFAHTMCPSSQTWVASHPVWNRQVQLRRTAATALCQMPLTLKESPVISSRSHIHPAPSLPPMVVSFKQYSELL